MDPLSIISAAFPISKTVSSASITIYSFINETKNVDQNVKDLVTEVNALHRILTDIQNVLESSTVADAERRAPPDDSRLLWQTLYGSLDDCRITVVRLDSVLDPLRKKRSNWATQALRQLKMNLEDDEINSFRVQIHTHCSALKMALQMVNIRAAYMAPEVILADLNPRIESLQCSLDSLTKSLDEQRTEMGLMSKQLPKVDSQNTERLQTLAKHILSTATTVKGSTIAGGSVHGDPISHETRLRTMNWIPEPVPYEVALSTSSISQSHVDRTVFSSLESVADTETDLTVATEPLDDQKDAESDSEEEFEFDVTQRLLNNGKKWFDNRDYAKAVGFLQEGVAKSNRLPNTWRTKVDLREVPLMIATCKFHLKELGPAEEDLLMLVRQESIDDQDAIRKCQISYLLSQIFLIKNELEASEEYCRKSLKGRRRLLGKENENYFASLYLLSEICLARGKHREAVVYQEIVPSEIAQRQKTLWPEGFRLKTGHSEVVQPQQRTRPEDFHPENTDSKIVQMPQRTRLEDSRPQTATAVTNVTEPSRESAVKPFDTLGYNEKPVNSVAFSPDGKLLAAGGTNGQVELWDMPNGARSVTIQARIAVSSIAFSPDNQLLALGGGKEVKLWNTLKQEWGTTFDSENPVFTVDFSMQGGLLVAGSYDGRTVFWKVWYTRNVALLRKLQNDAPGVRHIAFSPDGKLVVAGSDGGTARLWDLKTGALLRLINGHDARVCVAFSPKGNLLATGSADSQVLIWNTGTWSKLAQICDKSMRGVDTIAFSKDGKLMAAGIQSEVWLWYTEIWAVRDKFEVRGRGMIKAVVFSPNGKLLAIGSYDGAVELRNITTR